MSFHFQTSLYHQRIVASLVCISLVPHKQYLHPTLLTRSWSWRNSQGLFGLPRNSFLPSPLHFQPVESICTLAAMFWITWMMLSSPVLICLAIWEPYTFNCQCSKEMDGNSILQWAILQRKREFLRGFFVPKKVGILPLMFISALSHVPKPISCGEWRGLKKGLLKA